MDSRGSECWILWLDILFKYLKWTGGFGTVQEPRSPSLIDKMGFVNEGRYERGGFWVFACKLKGPSESIDLMWPYSDPNCAHQMARSWRPGIRRLRIRCLNQTVPASSFNKQTSSTCMGVALLCCSTRKVSPLVSVIIHRDCSWKCKHLLSFSIPMTHFVRNVCWIICLLFFFCGEIYR